MNKSTLISFASWEDRFYLGFEKNINSDQFGEVILFYFDSYAERTEPNRTKTVGICQKKQIYILSHSIEDDPAAAWKAIVEVIKNSVFKNNILIDISTMPREVIWILFDLMHEFHPKVEINYVYFTPEEYNKAWLSRDPGRPRMVYKLSGINKFDSSTLLIILTGYDVHRVRQLIDFFEPEKTILGIQTGDQHGNKEIKELYYQQYGNNKDLYTLIDIDSYTENRGFQELENSIIEHIDNYNIVMTSLGPKLAAVSLYKLHKKYPDTGLAYAPSRDFNPDYSKGLKDEYLGCLSLNSEA